MIKQQPADFIVREINNVKIKDQGKYLYFKLKKINRNTLDVVKELAKQLRIKEKKVGFAGSKDKHAVTEQVISILGVDKKKIEDKIRIDNTEFEFLGYGNKPISLGDLEGNEFEIVIRDLDNFSLDKTNFVENYFDEQRFSKNNSAIGRHLIKKEFGEAVKLVDNNRVKEHLEKNKNDFIGALKKLPTRLLRMYIHAYQSYLWNETLAEYLKNKEVATEVVKEVEYSLGRFVFVVDGKNFVDLQIPLIGFGSENLENKELKPVIQKIMEKENINYHDFVIKQIPELSLEGELRKVFVEIKDFKIGETEDDELNKDKKKIKIGFSLPKGSYATIVVKRILG